MDRTDGDSKGSLGTAIGGLAILGALGVGIGAVFVAVLTMGDRKWEATGLCLIAAAFAFGLAANAVWRK